MTRCALALALCLAPISIAHAQTTSVDLLHAVPTEVSVSSVYRDQRAQADRLVDDDLETAWNSRTDDLVGAWIDVRIPASATVTGIGITPGFTHVTADRDLFTGNHRVSQIRVLRDGREVGSYPVDASSRGLVTIPVSGPGGVYRIEVAAVLPGSRTDWRETCISELRVFGTDPSMAPATRTPQLGVGALPSVAGTAAERAQRERDVRTELTWIDDTWSSAEMGTEMLGMSEHQPVARVPTLESLDTREREVLEHVAALVAPIDSARADALRALEQHPAPTSAAERGAVLETLLDPIAAALELFATTLGTDTARCRVARVLVSMRLWHLEGAAWRAQERALDWSDPSMSASLVNHIIEDNGALMGSGTDWSTSPASVARRLLRRATPADATVAANWPALVQRLQQAQSACGWATP